MATDWKKLEEGIAKLPDSLSNEQTDTDTGTDGGEAGTAPSTTVAPAQREISLEPPTKESTKATSAPSVIDAVKGRIAAGEEPYVALFTANHPKPQRDTENMKALRKAAMWQAIANAVGVLGGAAGAAAGKGGFAGYAPNVKREGVEGFLDQMNQKEEDYKTLNKEYMDGQTRAAMYDLQRKIALEEKAEEREYQAQKRDEARLYAEQQAEDERERVRMDTAIEWGVFNGSFDEWKALTPNRRAELISQAAERGRNYKLTPKPKSTTPKSKPESTIVLPMKNGQSMVVPKAQMNNANWEAVYAAMVGADSSHQAIGNPRYNSYSEIIGYYPPTLQQKIAAIQRNYASSPAAQKRMEEIVGARGKQGVQGEVPPVSSLIEKYGKSQEQGKPDISQYKKKTK